MADNRETGKPTEQPKPPAPPKGPPAQPQGDIDNPGKGNPPPSPPPTGGK